MLRIMPGLLGLVLLAGCASGPVSAPPSAAGNAGSGASGGSLWDQFAEARRRRESSRGSDVARFEAERPGPPLANRETLARWWAAFTEASPDWPDLRARWMGRPEPEPALLIENLILFMVRAYDAGNGRQHHRARQELFEVRGAAIPYLVEALSGHRGDDVVRNLCVETLVPMGDDAAGPLMAAFDGAGEKGRRNLLRALKRLRSPASIPFLMEAARSGPFELRIEAIEGLGLMADRRALPVILACLSDDDESVRKFAAHYAGAFGDTSAVEPLIACLERSVAEGRSDIAEAATESLCRITGRRLGADPSAWRRAKGGR